MKIKFIILFIILSNLKVYSDDLDKYLYAYWSFDDSTAKDFSGNNFHGTIVNNPIPVPGVKGACFHFIGKGIYKTDTGSVNDIGDFILVPRIPFESLPEFTVSLWVKEESFTSNGGSGYIFFGEVFNNWLGIYHAGHLPDTTSFIKMSTGSINDVLEPVYARFDININRHKWMYYVMTYNNGQLAGYRNGKLIGSKYQPVKIFGNNGGIATNWWYWTERRQSAQFTGCIDEVKIYKKALSSKEIDSLFNLYSVSISASADTICKNDSLVITASDGFFNYKWNTGDTTKSIKIFEPGDYYVTAINKNADTVFDDFLLTKVDYPDFTIEGGNLICRNAPLKLYTSSLFNSYKWTTGDTTQEIIISKKGIYGVIATNCYGCFAYHEIQVDETDFKHTIDGNRILCPGDENKLTINGDPFTACLWNTGSQSKNLFVNLPGKYWAIVSNGTCYDTVFADVIQRDIKLEGIDSVDFSYQLIDNEAIKTIKFTNKSDFDILINNIYFKGLTNQIFDISYSVSLPYSLPSDSSITLDIKFLPTELKEYLDSLIININQPCNNFLSYEVKGKSYSNNNLVWLPDTSGKPSINIFKIPLRANLSLSQDKSYDLSYCIKISMDKDVYIPLSIYKGKLISNKIEENKRIIVLEDSGFVKSKFKNTMNILNYINGEVCLSYKNYSPVNIDTFYWKNLAVQPQIKNGSLTVTPLCQNDLDHVQIFDTTKFIISPNPTSNLLNVNIETVLTSDLFVDIYTLTGQFIKSIKISNNNPLGRKVELTSGIDLNELSSNIYLLILRNEGIIKTVVINKVK